MFSYVFESNDKNISNVLFNDFVIFDKYQVSNQLFQLNSEANKLYHFFVIIYNQAESLLLLELFSYQQKLQILSFLI